MLIHREWSKMYVCFVYIREAYKTREFCDSIWFVSYIFHFSVLCILGGIVVGKENTRTITAFQFNSLHRSLFQFQLSTSIQVNWSQTIKTLLYFIKVKFDLIQTVSVLSAKEKIKINIFVTVWEIKCCENIHLIWKIFKLPLKS